MLVPISSWNNKPITNLRNDSFIELFQLLRSDCFRAKFAISDAVNYRPKMRPHIRESHFQLHTWFALDFVPSGRVLLKMLVLKEETYRRQTLPDTINDVIVQWSTIWKLSVSGKFFHSFLITSVISRTSTTLISLCKTLA